MVSGLPVGYTIKQILIILFVLFFSLKVTFMLWNLIRTYVSYEGQTVKLFIMNMRQIKATLDLCLYAVQDVKSEK